MRRPHRVPCSVGKSSSTSGTPTWLDSHLPASDPLLLNHCRHRLCLSATHPAIVASSEASDGERLAEARSIVHAIERVLEIMRSVVVTGAHVFYHRALRRRRLVSACVGRLMKRVQAVGGQMSEAQPLGIGLMVLLQRKLEPCGLLGQLRGPTMLLAFHALRIVRGKVVVLLLLLLLTHA